MAILTLVLRLAVFWPWFHTEKRFMCSFSPRAPFCAGWLSGQRGRGKTSRRAGSGEGWWRDLVSPWKTWAHEENPGDPVEGSPGLQAQPEVTTARLV